MQLVAKDGVAWSVCLSVSLSVCHKNNNSTTAGLADHDLARAKNNTEKKTQIYRVKLTLCQAFSQVILYFILYMHCCVIPQISKFKARDDPHPF